MNRHSLSDAYTENRLLEGNLSSQLNLAIMIILTSNLWYKDQVQPV